MLIYSDVSADPTAFSRSNLREAQLAEARALGFDNLAWVAAVVNDVPADVPREQSQMLSAVMFRRGARMTLSISYTSEVGDDYCLKTLFTDGSIVMTESEPKKNAFRLMLGCSSAPRYGVDLAFVPMTSLADFVERHNVRVRAREAKGAAPVANHDLRAHFAMRKRWREIADPRMRLQTKIAVGIGGAVLASVVAAPIVAARPLTSLCGEAVAHVLRTAGIVGCVPIGFAAFTFALYWIAPVIARLAPAPAMRPADELLELADGVRGGRLPDREVAVDRTTPAVADLSAAELEQLQRRDLLVTMLSALAFPIVALASMATLGLAPAWIILSLMFTFDGIVTLVTKKTPTTLLRERFVPELVRAEASIPAAACGGGACLLPKGWGAWFRLALGTLGMLAIPKVLAWPHEPVTMTPVSQWAFAAFMIVMTTLSQTKKRHKLLLASTGRPVR